HGAKDVGVPEVARAREIDVDHVEVRGARLDEGPRGGRRIAAERRPRGPHRAGPRDGQEPAAGDVERRDDLEGHGSERYPAGVGTGFAITTTSSGSSGARRTASVPSSTRSSESRQP